jgi:hypothetical protein
MIERPRREARNSVSSMGYINAFCEFFGVTVAMKDSGIAAR